MKPGKGIYPSPFHRNLSEEEELQNDEKYYHWVKDSMAKMLEAIGTLLSTSQSLQLSDANKSVKS